ncbi:hypothetical protein QTI33_08335 [Variovorax sp. J22P271]|nr:hypothetical protein [Variovorax sp. J22P271]MDM0032142.1 hypothetical protein [Variovorax sp. J22P271]
MNSNREVKSRKKFVRGALRWMLLATLLLLIVVSTYHYMLGHKGP